MNTMFLQIKKKTSLKNKTAKKYYAKYETLPFGNLYKRKLHSIQFLIDVPWSDFSCMYKVTLFTVCKSIDLIAIHCCVQSIYLQLQNILINA